MEETTIPAAGAIATREVEDDSVGARAYRQIRSDIIFSKLAPGQKLRLDALRQQYGVGIGTLRELLSRLVAEGLVLAEGQRGFEVSPVSAANLREIAGLRLLLEGHALEQSVAAGDMEWEGRVVAAHHKLALMEKRMVEGQREDTELWKRYDWEFHHALISACGSAALLELHAPIYDKYLRYQMVLGLYRGGIAADEHHRLLACALQRDATAARDILATHINACVEYTVRENRLP
jgi:DNA-binding GntR family transcriptional regulator